MASLFCFIQTNSASNLEPKSIAALSLLKEGTSSASELVDSTVPFYKYSKMYFALTFDSCREEVVIE